MLFARLAKSLPHKKAITSLHLLIWILVALCVLNACNDAPSQNPTDTKSTTQKAQDNQEAQNIPDTKDNKKAKDTQKATDFTASDFVKSPFALFSSEVDSALSSVFKPSLEILQHDTNKPILLFFGSPFCKPCKNISQNIAQSTPLQDALKSHYQVYFINILSKEPMQINLPFLAKSLAQKNSTKNTQNPQNNLHANNQPPPKNHTPFATTQKDFSLALGVRATPTLMFLDAKGEEIFRFVGGISTEHLAIMLDFLKSPPTNKNQQQIALELHSIFKAQNPN